jgi:transcriptional regulator with XRE-family HTH domain
MGYNLLRTKREELGLTREKLAAQLGLSVSTIFRLEQNNRLLDAKSNFEKK